MDLTCIKIEHILFVFSMSLWIISRGSLAGDDDGGVMGTLVDVETSVSHKLIISCCSPSKSKVEPSFGFLCYKINSFMIYLACGGSSLTLLCCLLLGTAVYKLKFL